jgi:hypothetical protein
LILFGEKIMETREIEVTKTEKIYELTETEYKELINNSRSYGAIKTKEYIIFCYNNYIFPKKNINGIVNLVNDLMEFVICKTDYFPNIYKLSFWDWLENNR